MHALAPAREYAPAEQLEQLDDTVDPVTATEVPEGHEAQLDDEEIGWYMPEPQLIHEEAPTKEKLPALHAKQLAARSPGW